MTTVNIALINRATIKIGCDQAVARHMYEFFTFTVPGYKYMPAYVNGAWDGKIHLFNMFTGELLAGLYSQVVKLCETHGYKVNTVATAYGLPGVEYPVDRAALIQFIESLNTPFTAHDHQVDAIAHAIKGRRALLVCPTASGKSFIAYILTRYMMVMQSKKILIIVPFLGLVQQLLKDFNDYGGDPEMTHIIYAGKDKKTDKRVVISTWQSIYKQPAQWFKQFGAIIGDEAHQFKATSLTTIMNKGCDAEWRIGMTGTTDGVLPNELTLEGLFAPKLNVTTTKELQDKGILAKLDITIPMLSYSDDVRAQSQLWEYADEINFLIKHPKRNNFIANIAAHQKGNTLVFFRREEHGRALYELILKKVGNTRKVYFISGTVDVDDREAIRQIVEKMSDAIIIASSGTTSTGTNIRNLHHLIFTHPSKGRIKVMQSIGRGLRIADNGWDTTLIDIMDDMSPSPRKLNTVLRHGMERIKMYKAEQFPFKIVKVNIDD